MPCTAKRCSGSAGPPWGLLRPSMAAAGPSIPSDILPGRMRNSARRGLRSAAAVGARRHGRCVRKAAARQWARDMRPAWVRFRRARLAPPATAGGACNSPTARSGNNSGMRRGRGQNDLLGAARGTSHLALSRCGKSPAMNGKILEGGTITGGARLIADD